jgi:type IV secretion system protein TrbE
MFSLREYREPSTRLPDYLPWAALVAPGVVLQKDGVLQKTVGFRGHDLASSSLSEVASAMARLNNAIKRLGSGWAIFVEAQRLEANRYPAASWSHPAAWLVDYERKRAFEESGKHFESSYYLTFVWKLPTKNQSRLEALFFHDPDGAPSSDTARDLELFCKSVAELVDIMRGVFVEVAELDDDQTLTYLHSTISTNRHPVTAPETPMYLDAILPDMAFTPGDVPMLGDDFIPTCTIEKFPATSLPGLLDQLNQTEIEYRWVTRYISLDKSDATVELEKYRRKWWTARKGLFKLLKEQATNQESPLVDNAAANNAADADTALQSLGADLVSFGYFTATITVWDPDLERARRKMQVVKQVVQGRGFTLMHETLNSREAWLGSLPGHVYANVRRPLVSSLNLVHMLPTSAVWAGDAANSHLAEVTGCAQAHVQCSTVGATPFRLNLNVGDVGHTLVIGPTGAGKSTLLATLAIQWLRYPGAEVVIFDRDRSARATTLAVGGSVYEPGNPAAASSFQPLRGIHEPSERVWAAGFVLDLLACQSVACTPEIQAEIDQVLANLATSELRHRTLSVLAGMLRPELKAALRPYTVDGNFGQIFDAAEESLRPSFWQMFELGHLMALGPAAVVPALDYLFHRVEGQFDGRPTLLILDEAWLFLAHPVFMRRVQAWLKTLRKKNVYVVFATQEVADAADSPITATILSACHTKIYLPDEEAMTPLMSAAYAAFGLTETEIRLLAQAQKKVDYYYRSVRGRRLFRLDLGPVGLAFAGMSAPADQKALDRIVAEGRPEEYAERILAHRKLDWAAELLAEARSSGQRTFRT